ncbi:MAG: pyridoxal phosphate-dependent aminotransferase [Acidobacteriia bacterium]|nr:pyridoxal phosphate-dependent aminotransferase [Terriglobia bacterium]
MFASRTDWSLTPNRLSKAIEERRRAGLPILDLTESNPTRCAFSFEAEKVLGSLADPRSLTYEPDPKGLLRARQAVAEYYAERGVQVPPERIFLTASTSEAYSFLFRLLVNPGEAVLAPRPSYPLFEFLAGLNDLELLPYSIAYHDGWQFDVQAIAEILRHPPSRVRAIVVVHPNNPTGSFVSREELRLLAACCREHGLALIADEVFADYAFEADARRVVSHADVQDALTFTLSGLSKISALPQMKLAWVAVSGPPELVQPALARLEIIADTYLSVSAPVAHALPAMLETRHSVQPQILERVRSNLAWLDTELSPEVPVTRLRVEGGWYAVLRLPAIESDEDWAVKLLAEDGIFVHPGHFYDFGAEGHLVVSLLPTTEIFRKGISKVLARVRRAG